MTQRDKALEIAKLAGEMTIVAREAIRNKSGLTGKSLSDALDAIDLSTFENIASKTLS